MFVLAQVSLQEVQEKEVISYCQKNEQHLSYRAVISTVRDLKVKIIIFLFVPRYYL